MALDKARCTYFASLFLGLRLAMAEAGEAPNLSEEPCDSLTVSPNPDPPWHLLSSVKVLWALAVRFHRGFHAVAESPKVAAQNKPLFRIWLNLCVSLGFYFTKVSR